MSLGEKIHDELNRLILRCRFISWSLKNWRPGDYRLGVGRHMILSARLTRWKPTYEERREAKAC